MRQLTNEELGVLCRLQGDVAEIDWCAQCQQLLQQNKALQEELDRIECIQDVEAEVEPFQEELAELQKLCGCRMRLSIHYFTDPQQPTWYRLEADGHTTAFCENFTFGSARRQLLAMFAEAAKPKTEPDIEAIKKELTSGPAEA